MHPHLPTALEFIRTQHFSCYSTVHLSLAAIAAETHVDIAVLERIRITKRKTQMPI